MWVKIDDKFPQHPKAKRAGQAGRDLFVAGLAYANRHQTGGFIPLTEVPHLVDEELSWLARIRVRVGRWISGDRLVDAVRRLASGDRPQWIRTERDGLPGYLIHDYGGYQPIVTGVDRKREKSRQRARKSYVKKRWAKGDQPNLLSADRAQTVEKSAAQSADRAQSLRADALPIRDPGTYPSVRTSNVVLLSQQQATRTQKLPARKQNAPANPADPVENPDEETRTPAFLRSSPDFAEPADPGYPSRARGLLDDGRVVSARGSEATADRHGFHVPGSPQRSPTVGDEPGARRKGTNGDRYAGATESADGRSALADTTADGQQFHEPGGPGEVVPDLRTRFRKFISTHAKGRP